MKPPFRRSPSSPPDDFWMPSRPGPLRDPAMPTLPTPLDLFDGLDVNELDSESVFDRFFGKTPPPQRRR